MLTKMYVVLYNKKITKGKDKSSCQILFESEDKNEAIAYLGKYKKAFIEFNQDINIISDTDTLFQIEFDNGTLTVSVSE